ncbi:MAG: hypothetical protein OXJ53_12485 [Gammaproteobacteria bacterium]|nr:hypothetical protein [Gammaproteobacteria bacterium]MDE0272506.1 hypothetical protein [Gammaproteobacteria bacterium]
MLLVAARFGIDDNRARGRLSPLAVQVRSSPYIFHYDLTLISPVALWAWQRAVFGEGAFWMLIWGLPLLILRLNAVVGSLLLTTALQFTVLHVAREAQGLGTNRQPSQ